MLWPACQQCLGGVAHRRQQLGVAHQVGDLELQEAGLASTEHLAGAAQLQVLFGNQEAVAGFAHDRQAFAAQLRQRRVVEQHAVARRAAAADPSAQLVQLRQAQAFGVLDDHQAGVGHVDAHLDDGGGHQQLQFAALELLHHRGLLGRLHAAMDQSDGKLTERGRELLEGGLRGLAGEFLGLLDQRADPVGLTALAAGGAHPLDDFQTAAVGDHQGVHRRTARWQLVEDRGIEVGIGAHRQGPRNGRGGHDQLMRAEPAVDALLAQGQALLHAEAVLLVDDHQGQALEDHFVLEQRMGADHHRAAAGDLLQRRGAGLALELAGQPGDLDAERLQPLAEVEKVLLGEDFRRRHQRHLIAGFQCLQRSKGGDHGLAGTDVALHQAQHGFVLGQVIGDLGADALLRAGGAEAEVGEKALWQSLGRWQLWRLLGAYPLAQALQRQLMGQQFLEGQAVLGPVAAFGEFFQIGVGRRTVQVAQGLIQRAEPIITGQLGGQPVRKAVRAEPRQRLLAEVAQALLGQALGGRVDRRQGLFHRCRLAGQCAVFRVVDLQPRGTGTRLAVAAQLGAALHGFLLRLAEGSATLD